MKMIKVQKLGTLITLLGALSLGACGGSDPDTSGTPTDGSRKESSSGTQEDPADTKKPDSADQSANSQNLEELFKYTLLEEEDTVLLTAYIGEEENVTVFGSYKIGGKEYRTLLADGVIEHGTKNSPFRNDTTIRSLTFVGGVKCNNCSEYFSYCTNLETIDLSGLDTSECSDFSGMFNECKSLQAVDLSPLDFGSLTDLYSMFSGCKSLTELDFSMVDTSNVTNFSSLFAYCSSLQNLNIEGMDTSSSTYFASMFDGCSSLTSIDLSGFDTSHADAMPAMFRGCESLTGIDLSSFDTSLVDGMGSMFAGCKSLTSIDVSGFNTSSNTDLSNMFSGCEGLTDIDLSCFDTSHVRDLSGMFAGCTGLQQLDISHFTINNSLKYSYDMFKSCENLTAVYVNQNFYDYVYSDQVKNNDNMFKDSSISDFTVK